MHISQHIYGFPKVNHPLSDLWMGKKDFCRSKSFKNVYAYSVCVENKYLAHALQ